MKSIENSSVLNTWVLLVDFLNEHWFIAAATCTETFFIRFCDTDNESAGHKEGFKPNFPNFPAVRPKAKLFEPQQIWYKNAPNLTSISKIAGLLEKHPCVTRNCA